jgi:hypothetical protein
MDARVIGKPGQQLAGIQKMMVTVLPTASEPVISKQLSDRLMIIVPELVCSVICVLVNPITFPLASVLFPMGGGRVGRGLGVGMGRVPVVAGALVFFSSVQLTRSAAPARMQISFFVFIG